MAEPPACAAANVAGDDDGDLAAERSRAFELVCAIVNPFPGAGNRAPGSHTASDWAAAYDFAAFHGIRPALHKAMSGGVAPSPAATELRERLAIFQRDHRFRVMQTTGQIVRLAKAFEGAGIEALFFKGAMLGEQIYGGAQFREFNDVDVLVRPGQRRHAEAVLAALEFVPIVDDVRLRDAFFDYLGQHIYRNFANDTVVDFHWRFVGAGPFPISTDDALASRVRLKLAGADIPVPAVAAQALILAGHGHKENWSSFGWILDFATFASVNPELDWGKVAKAARSRSCLVPVLTAVLLVQRLFAHTIDGELAKIAASRPVIVKSVVGIVARSGALTQRRLADEFMGGFRLCETPLQKAGMAIGLLTTPTIGDYEAMPLGPRWWWLYRITRPARLALRRLLRRAPGESSFWAQKRDARS